MVVHQAQDAENDRRAGLRTWGTRERVREQSHRLMVVLVPLEAVSFAAAFAPLVGHPSVAIAAAAALGAWMLATVSRPRRVDWLSFTDMPLESLYAVFAPVVVAVAFLRWGTWTAPAWIAIDAVLRAPALRRIRDTTRP